MQPAGFQITANADDMMIDVTIGGFFSESDVARFSAAFDAALDELGSAPNEHVTLIDMREMMIQPQTSVGAFRDVLSDPHKRSKRLAFVVAASLARMQIKRAAQGRDARYFTQVEDARHWLITGEEGNADESGNPARGEA